MLVVVMDFFQEQFCKKTASNIKNLLLTQKGERVGQPTFGSDLPSILFEQRTEDIQDKIETTIRERYLIGYHILKLLIFLLLILIKNQIKLWFKWNL